MQPVDFYRELLLSTGIKENQDGIGFVTEGSSVPLTVKKKVLVLPTEEIQANYNNSQDDIQVFHPACENVMRKDSEVFNFLKKLYRASLFIDLQQVMLDLAEFSADNSKQGKMNKRQRTILSLLSEFDEKTKANLEKVFDKIDINGDTKAIDLTVQRGGEVDGTRYNRVGMVRIPFWQDLEEAKDHIHGVKIRKKDIEAYNQILNVIFSDTAARTEDHVITVGTNSSTAPSFVALTLAYIKAKEEIIRVHDIFKDKFHDISSSNLEWQEGLNELNVYRGLIPMYPGNEGEPTIAESKERKRLPEPEAREESSRPRANNHHLTNSGRHTPAKPINEEPLTKPLTWAEIQQKRYENKSYRYDDRDNGRSNGRYNNSGRSRRYGNNIDLSDVDPNMIQEREAYYHDRDHRRGYRDRYDDRYRRDDRRDARRPRTLNDVR